jgi:hypothetical protein
MIWNPRWSWANGANGAEYSAASVIRLATTCTPEFEAGDLYEASVLVC